MKTVYVFLAEGFEEIEAIVPIDILRRAGVPVITVGLGSMPDIAGSHGITVQADTPGDGFVLPQDAGMVVLPGGGLGTQNLSQSEVVRAALQAAAERELPVAAICAAPTVLHQYGMLKGKKVTAFPSVQQQLTGCTVTGTPVEEDGNIITARSAGVALQFAQQLAARMTNPAIAQQVVESVYP